MCHMAHIDTKLGCLAAASITAIVLSVIVFSLHLARYEQIPPLNPLVACPSCTSAWPRDSHSHPVGNHCLSLEARPHSADWPDQ